MTILYAYDQTDLESVNLNYWYGIFNDGDELAVGGVDYDLLDYPYEFAYTLYTTLNDALSLYGSDFDYDDETFVSQGFIQDLSQWAWNGVDEWIERWHWQGWDMSMWTFWNAGQSTDVSDDLAILKAVLSNRDIFYLSEFSDTMRGFDGRDDLFGAGGDDVLHGNKGKDKLWGGADNDELHGGQAADWVSGNTGDDILYGDDGRDTLRGGAGKDVITGGADEDTFYYKIGDEKDIILDFETSFDVIDLSDLGFEGTWIEFKRAYTEKSGTNLQNTRIDLGDGDSIVLKNVYRGDLDADDFIL